jgi:hypothetical protein
MLVSQCIVLPVISDNAGFTMQCLACLHCEAAININIAETSTVRCKQRKPQYNKVNMINVYAGFTMQCFACLHCEAAININIAKKNSSITNYMC